MSPEENNNWCGGCLNNDGKGSSFAVNHQGKFYSCIRYMDSSLLSNLLYEIGLFSELVNA